MARAFQPNAFQVTAFQAGDIVSSAASLAATAQLASSPKSVRSAALTLSAVSANISTTIRSTRRAAQLFGVTVNELSPATSIARHVFATLATIEGLALSTKATRKAARSLSAIGSAVHLSVVSRSANATALNSSHGASARATSALKANIFLGLFISPTIAASSAAIEYAAGVSIGAMPGLNGKGTINSITPSQATLGVIHATFASLTALSASPSVSLTTRFSQAYSARSIRLALSNPSVLTNLTRATRASEVANSILATRQATPFTSRATIRASLVMAAIASTASIPLRVLAARATLAGIAKIIPTNAATMIPRATLAATLAHVMAGRSVLLGAVAFTASVAQRGAARSIALALSALSTFAGAVETAKESEVSRVTYAAVVGLGATAVKVARAAAVLSSRVTTADQVRNLGVARSVITARVSSASATVLSAVALATPTIRAGTASSVRATRRAASAFAASTVAAGTGIGVYFSAATHTLGTVVDWAVAVGHGFLKPIDLLTLKNTALRSAGRSLINLTVLTGVDRTLRNSIKRIRELYTPTKDGD